MKQFRLLFLLVLSVALLLATACASTEAAATNEQHVTESSDEEHDDSRSDHNEEDGHNEADDGHSAANHIEPPEEFAGLINEFAGDHEAIEAGEETYNTLCATCHGDEGKGDGLGAAELDPKPADLSDSVMMSDLSDGYLYWRVTKGGAMEPFNSAMPIWETSLTEEQRWQVISYVRTFSGTSGSMADDDHADDDHADDDHADDDHADDDHADDDHGD